MDTQWINGLKSTHIKKKLLLKIGGTQTWLKKKWKNLLETNKTCRKWIVHTNVLWVYLLPKYKHWIWIKYNFEFLFKNQYTHGVHI